MVKIFKRNILFFVLAAAFALSLALSLLSLVPADAAQKENVAFGKTAVFKSLDMSEDLKMYNYSPPENIGGNGTIADGNKNVLTDGDPEWGMGNANCTAKDVVGWVYLDLGQEYVIDGVGVSFLGEHFFEDVVIQVSTSADFSENVSTVLATSDKVLEGAEIIYDGGELFNDGGLLSGLYKGVYKWYVQSVSGKIHDYNFAPRAARYVRLTDKNNEHAKDSNTVLAELEVYAAEGENFAPAPTLFPGEYTYLQDIGLSVPYQDAEIYYTTDGSFPCREKDLYTGPIAAASLPANFTLRTAAKLSDGSWTNVGEYEYKIDNVALTRPAEFKSLDMSETLEMYCYYPDGNTGNGSVGCYPMSVGPGCSLTNGQFNTWMNYQTNSTWKDTVGWAVIDFGASYTVDRLGMTLLSGWVYGDIVVQLSDDPAFKTGVTTVLANTTAPLKVGETVVYDGAQVNVAGRPQFSGDNNAVYTNTADVLTYFDFDEVTARYARLTNRCTNNGGDNNTVFVEIQFYSAEHDKNFEAGAVSMEREEMAGTSFANGTALETILGAMPSAATVHLHDGTVHENISLVWSCPEWKENTAGKFVFTPEFIGLQNVANICDDSIVITIEQIETSVNVAYKGESLFTSSAYPSAEDFTVTSETAGKLTIAEGTLKEGKNIISWTFTPDDANYAVVVGTTEVTVSPVTLTGISVTVQPAKTEYVAGENFDATGMVVTATYDDGNSKAVTGYTVSPQTLRANDTKVIVTYQGKTAEITVTVTKVQTVVNVTYTGAALYTSSAYPTAADFKAESNTEGVLTITSGTLVAGENTIEWTYTPDDIDNYTVVTGTIKVNAEAVVLTGIEITDQPDKTEYQVGETFDKTGMVVTAVYNDGSSQVITDYAADKTALAYADTVVMITYQGKTATVAVTVRKLIPEVTVSYEGSALFTSSAYPTAADFKAESEIRGVLTIASGTLVAGSVSVKWTFTPEDGDTYEVATGTVKINVTAVALKGIEITVAPSKTQYAEGETFDKMGMVVTAIYNDGSSQVITDYTVDKTKLTKTDTVITVSYGDVSATLEIIVKADGCGSVIVSNSIAIAVAAISAFAFAFAVFRKKNAR